MDFLKDEKPVVTQNKRLNMTENPHGVTSQKAVTDKLSFYNYLLGLITD
jgi:hypothetical protein